MNKSAHLDAQCKQKGIIDPKIIIGGIVVLVVIFFVATGNFKFSASVKDSNKPASNAEEQPTPEVKSKPKTYQNEANGFSLEYPENWNIKENPSKEYLVAFYSPKENSSDDYTEFLGIKAVDIPSKSDSTLLEIADLWENQTRDASKDTAFSVTDRKSASVSGAEAKDIEYSAKFEGEDMKGMVRITLNAGKAYIFQYNAKANAYDKFLPDVESILDSVKF